MQKGSRIDFPFFCIGELYFQVQHFNKIKKFIQKLLYNGIATNKKTGVNV